MSKRQALIISALALASCNSMKDNQKPNVIFILADDLGYGDLSCLGQTNFHTPNIDRLASEGMLFTQHYSGATVSAPSRSSLLTGLHGGHSPVRDNKEMETEGQYPMSSEHWTLFDLFNQEDYVTGVFGKWGLGYPGSDGDPKAHGVDDFYGYNCQRYAHSYYPDYLWDNDTKVILEGNGDGQENEYAPYLIHDQAVEFIRNHKDEPFFMMYTNVLPHAEFRLPENLIEPFIGKFGQETPFTGKGLPDKFRIGAYMPQDNPKAAFAAMVTLLDSQVGDIMQTLEEEGLADNTIVVFASDNGPHIEAGATPGYFGSSGGFRGVKRDLYEGGIHIPFIVRWDGKVKPGSVSEHVSAFWDFLPTMADVLGVSDEHHTDGISFLPELTGEGIQEEHDYLYWEYHRAGGRQAVRKGNWKAVAYGVEGGRNIELYDLSSDPSESRDLAEQYPEIIAQMDSIMCAAHIPSKIFPFPSDN
jgi:arylsulfatase A-like enzyme